MSETFTSLVEEEAVLESMETLSYQVGERAVDSAAGSEPVKIDGEAIPGTEIITTDEWLTRHAIADLAGVDFATISKRVEVLREEHPDWFKVMKGKNGKLAEHCSHVFASRLITEFSSVQDAPSEWRTSSNVARELGISGGTLRKYSDQFREAHPEWFRDYRSQGSRTLAEHYSPDLVSSIRQSFSERRFTPDGWQTKSTIAKQLGVSADRVYKVAEQICAEHTELGAHYFGANNRLSRHYSPKVALLLKQQLGRSEVPSDWNPIARLAPELGLSRETLLSVAKDIREKNKGMFMDVHTSGTGRTTLYCAPDALLLLKEKIQTMSAPESWLPYRDLAVSVGVAPQTALKKAEELLADHPEWFGEYRIAETGSYTTYLSPEAVRIIEGEFARSQSAPTDWITFTKLSSDIGVSRPIVVKTAEELLADHPEWFGEYRVKRNNRVSIFCSPEASSLIKQELSKTPSAPEDWRTVSGLSGLYGISFTATETLIQMTIADHPEWHKVCKGPSGHSRDYYSPHLSSYLKELIDGMPEAPEGWKTYYMVGTELNEEYRSIRSVAELFRDEHPEWFSDYRNPGGHMREHYHPDLVKAITDFTNMKNAEKSDNNRAREEVKRIQESAEEFISDIGNGEVHEAREIRGLVSLFGPERIVDILFQYHPEYKKVPMPYIKSVIADYLGDFLTVVRGLNLDDLESGVDFLFETTLKEGLIEVVKLDCLSFYNSLRNNSNLDAGDLEAILGHISDLRAETAHYTTEDLADVFDEVEDYYSSLFESINKPDSLIDELIQDRLFPDLNQRINIHEIDTKKKMLIADEMGVGKSASAILAKECLAVGQALIVAPSNVIDTWKDYLSDKVEDGKQIGYYKPGQSPRVLVVNGIEDLLNTEVSQSDYILISQERLTDRYVQALEDVSFDMLILDEIHKLKNLTSGKRAENVLRLAEKINDKDGDKYLALLSGTPIPNKIGDVAMVLKLLYPERFREASNKELTSQIINGDILDLRVLLVPRMQMKSLAESLKMPDVHEVIHRVELSAEEQEMYDVLLEEDELIASQKLQFLRKFNLNPRMLDASPDINGSKIRGVGESLRQTFADKDKVVMFVNGYIEDVIRGEDTIIGALGLSKDVEVYTIEGDVDQVKRAAIQHQLQNSSKKMLVLVSGQTADVGVDFSGAQEVYFYNEPWTEYDKKQQIGRVFRPGLNGDLVVRTFINAGTIEEGIHSYIKSKYIAIEKVLRGVPISEIEREMLKKSENQKDPNLEVNPELAKYYFSSWDRMMKIYGYVKELGEPDFVKFLNKYGREYAGCYLDVGGRSYQANASRLSGTLIDRFTREKRKPADGVRILDIASGPEMLRRHIPDELSGRVLSLDINRHHFESKGQNRSVGSFLSLPIADDSVDYVNLSLALHYTSFVPSKKRYERVEVLQEINRVLKDDGRAVISLMHTLDLKDEQLFRQAVARLGFRVVEQFSGKVEDGAHFRTRLFTLEKTHNGPRDLKGAIKILGPGLMNGLKFTKSNVKLRDSRKIATSFSVVGQRGLKTKFNLADQTTLEEEQRTNKTMLALQKKYGSVKDIPKDEVMASGLSRIFNGKSYALFRQLTSGPGAVVIR